MPSQKTEMDLKDVNSDETMGHLNVVHPVIASGVGTWVQGWRFGR